ncbi:hypothetical protein HOLleu_01704 [Holothuria leucospilota]|uniref:Uncharacterized protein n=1 Tax=Holothuria leucospilota TaxID=206669 RepID=A0A9Q1HKZ9_HOLLE|nr:hypothetical protein HOLleu_01704 [Holothuria leucospilota]
MFPGSDSTHNLKLGLSQICSQVDELQTSSWRDKKCSVFAFGDYEYLCRMYGISGASGKLLFENLNSFFTTF